MAQLVTHNPPPDAPVDWPARIRADLAAEGIVGEFCISAELNPDGSLRQVVLCAAVSPGVWDREMTIAESARIGAMVDAKYPGVHFRWIEEEGGGA